MTCRKSVKILILHVVNQYSLLLINDTLLPLKDPRASEGRFILNFSLTSLSNPHTFLNTFNYFYILHLG